MRSSLTVGLSVFALVAALPAVASVLPTKRPDLNAFINHKADTSSALVAQVEADPEVADRYQRHFSMNRQELVGYLSGLHRGTLAKDGVYTVYSIPEGGRVKMHMERLKKGSPMFLDARGRPTLIVKCGNPVVLGPQRVRRGNPLTLVPTGDDKTRQLSILTPRDADEVMNPDALVAMLPDVPEVIPPAVPPAVPAEETTTTTAAIATVPVTATGGGHGFPYAALLPLGFLGFLGHHGGNGGGGGFVPVPVPEPATMAAMAIGVVGLARVRRRKS